MSQSPTAAPVPVALVIGANGGSGSSLVAGGLALAWARIRGEVWLIDLDLERGDLGDAWGIPGEHTLAELAAVAAELDATHLRQAAHAHPSGVQVIVATGVPGAASGWAAASIHRLVDAARSAAGGGGAVVIDGGTGLSPAAFAAAERVSNIVIVCSPTVAAARRARRATDALAACGAAAPWALVVNDGPIAPEIHARAFGRALGQAVVCRLPWSEGEGRRLAAGGWPSGRRARLASAIDALAGAIG